VDISTDIGASNLPGNLAGYAAMGRMTTHARSARFIQTMRGPGGDTFELGERVSDRQLVVYNKRGPSRVELRLRRRAAAVAASAIAETGRLEGALVHGLSAFVAFAGLSVWELVLSELLVTVDGPVRRADWRPGHALVRGAR
jgi:hypothetical protein